MNAQELLTAAINMLRAEYGLHPVEQVWDENEAEDWLRKIADGMNLSINPNSTDYGPGLYW